MFVLILILISFFKAATSSSKSKEPKKITSNRSMKNFASTNQQLHLDDICKQGQTFLWDLLIRESTKLENLDADLPETTTNGQSLNELTNKDDEHQTNGTSPDNNNSEVRLAPRDSKSTFTSQAQILKLLKEAEKQLQTLLCLPSTDKRIRMKFIESCIHNLKANRACIVSLKLLTKLFGSFQQYATTNSQTSTSPPVFTAIKPSKTRLR